MLYEYLWCALIGLPIFVIALMLNIRYERACRRA